MKSNASKVLLTPIESNYYELIQKSFDTFGGLESLIKGNVFIKFNGTMQFKSAIADPELILSIIQVIQDHSSPKQIYVMENPAVATFSRIVFQIEDLSKRVKHLGAKPLYLDEEKSTKVNFEGEVLDKPIAIPKILHENLIKRKDQNTYINVAKLKAHVLSEMTCCIKNQHGLLYDEDKMYNHHLIHEKMVDIMNLFKPDFNIVDASSVVNYGPMAIFEDWEVPMNLIISGKDPVAVDTICSDLIGIDDVKHVRLAAERGFGNNKRDRIEVLPSEDLIDQYRVKLSHKDIPNPIPPSVKIFKGKEKTCKSGCSFLEPVFMWFGNQTELSKCIGIYGKGHNIEELDIYDGPFIVNGPCAIEELQDYFIQRQDEEDVEVHYIHEHLNIAEVGTALRHAMKIPISELKDLLPCSLAKMVALMFWAKFKGGKFISIR
ncbi:MAG: hypothetical protein BAJALOKI3v1_280014 [Promethearchaeota archaeon]|nr:MAG: hypothetical protein BAJALOKI3v1_280014 [Candidatus Lokiarchaeota archaeon]